MHICTCHKEVYGRKYFQERIKRDKFIKASNSLIAYWYSYCDVLVRDRSTNAQVLRNCVGA